jgi:hypothetical protein
MAIFEAMSLLALEPLLRTKCNTTTTGGNEGSATLPEDPLEAASPRLPAALAQAGDQAWLVLEVLLAGTSFWEGCHVYLGDSDWEDLSQHAQFLREKLRVRPGAQKWEEQRRLGLRELHLARKKGLLARPTGAEGTPDVRIPPRLLPAKNSFSLLLSELRQANLPHLAQLLESEEQTEPLLVRAVQYFFQHQLEQDPQLLPGVAARPARPSLSKQRQAFQLIAGAMNKFGRGLQEWIEEDMSEVSASAATEKSPTVKPSEKTVTTEAAPAAAEDANPDRATNTPPQNSRQRLLGLLVGLAGLLIPMLVVGMLLVRYMAHETRAFEGPTKLISTVAFSPDPERKLVAAASFDGTVWIWDRDTGAEVQVLMRDEDEQGGSVFALSFSPDGKKLVAGIASDARVYRVEDGTMLQRLKTNRNWVFCAAWSPDGKYIATSSKNERAIRLWDGETYQELDPKVSGSTSKGNQGLPALASGLVGLPGPLQGPGPLLFSWLGTHSEWSEKRPYLVGYKSFVTCMAFSPDSKYLLAGDGTVLRMWDLATGKLYREFDDHTEKVACVAFAPDGQHFAYAGFNQKIHLWDLEKNKLAKTFEGHESPVATLAFSPDGKLLASGSLAIPDDPRTIRLWSVATGRECYNFDSQKAVWSVAFSPDGSYLLSGGADLKVRLWWLP